jgi:hypothetical protein
VPRILVVEQQPPSADDHFLHRRQQVERVRLHRHVVLGLADPHLRPPGEQFVHQALEVGRQVLQHHERHAGVGREVREETLEGFEAAGGSADTDDVKVGWGVGRFLAAIAGRF